MTVTVLNGITWGHSRGITPLLALSQRYQELYPQTEIRWKKRSLQEFADFPIEKLAEEYDLLIIDHPWVGGAEATNCVLPLNEHLPTDYLHDQLANSTGYSHLSYNYSGRQWALAIDAATPVASYRRDLLEKHDAQMPGTWEELIKLAQKGKVAVPAIPIDLLMNFYSFCIAHRQQPFRDEHELIDLETGLRAIETMKELYSLVDRKMFDHNPIAVAERMSRTDDYWYCPFAYAYSNYARAGYADNLLHFGDVVVFNGSRLRTTIGGTGLAVSAFSKNQEAAVHFASLVASANWQKTLYVQHGGQPAHRSAWLDPMANLLTNNFFRSVLPVMDNGYLRPRYNGYLHFQDHAGIPLRECMMGKLSANSALEKMNALYRESLLHKHSIALA